jgi:translocation and assembly module TamB
MEATIRLLRPLLVTAALAGLLVLAALGLVALSATTPGRDFIAAQVARIAPESGLRVSIERLEGRPLRDFTARGLVLSDLDGPFLEIPEARVQWRPLALARNRLLVDRALAPEARLLRLPRLNPGDPDAPLLPSIAIRLGELRIERLRLEPEVAGRPFTLALAGSGDSIGGRLLAKATATSDAGDSLALDLDSRPDDDQFDLSARLMAPADGVVAGLTGIGRPLALTIDGDGGWSRWRGQLAATLAGRPLARLDLSAEAGRFGATGSLTPGDLLGEGAAARMAAPAVAVRASVDATDARRLALDLSLGSPAFSLAAAGPFERRRERFERVALSGRLIRPETLDPALKGPPIGLAGTLDGPLGGPAVALVASGPALAYGATGLERPRLELSADLGRRPASGRLALAVQRVTGLGAEIDPLLADLKASAGLRLAGDALLLDGLSATTARGRASGSARLDLASSRAEAALDLALPGYAIAGLGVADLSARARIASAPGRGLAVSGPVEARLTRLDNATLAGLTGGLPRLSGQLALAPTGAIALDPAALVSPRLNLAGTLGLGAGGALSGRLAGRSADYGPVTLALAGTTGQPVVDLALARPGLGVGLADVAARIRAEGKRWQVSARGRSDYGPVLAEATVLTAPALAIELARLDLAGLVARGRLVSERGGFAGPLTIVGRGVDATARLAVEAGGVQAATLEARFANASLPLAGGIGVGSGRLAATARLPASGLEAEGEAQLAGVAAGGARFARLSLSGRTRAGQGGLRFAGEGTATGGGDAVPFNLAGELGVTPERLSLDARGVVAGQEVRLADTAVATREADGWRLAPATLVLGQGRVTLAGRSGASTEASARIEALDLGRIALFAGQNLRGLASGEVRISLPAGGAPQGDARLMIRQVTRSGLARSSLPADLELVAALRGSEAAARAFLRGQGRVLAAGQAQLTGIAPGPAATLGERLLAAPMTGEVRINAPAETVWPLAGVDEIDLRGPLVAAATLGGTPASARISGQLRLSGGRLELPATGTVVSALDARGTFAGPRLELTSLTGRAGAGSIAGSGNIAFTAAEGLSAQLQAQLDNARLLDLPTLRGAATGPASVSYGRDGGLIAGDLVINSARYQLGATAEELVAELKVREVGRPAGRPAPARMAAPDLPWRLDVKARGDDRLEVTGLGLDSMWRADLRITGTAEAPRIMGTARVIRGEYDFAGRSFRLRRGEVRFQGEQPINPVVAIEATAEVQGLTARITISGQALQPDIAFASTPELPQDEVLSRLLFGSSVTDLSATEALQLAAALAQLQGGGGGLNPLGAIRKATGLDRLRLGASEEGASVMAGKYLSDRIYVEVGTDTRGNALTQVEIALTRALSILSRVETTGRNRVAVRWSKDY